MPNIFRIVSKDDPNLIVEDGFEIKLDGEILKDGQNVNHLYVLQTMIHGDWYDLTYYSNQVVEAQYITSEEASYIVGLILSKYPGVDRKTLKDVSFIIINHISNCREMGFEDELVGQVLDGNFPEFTRNESGEIVFTS